MLKEYKNALKYYPKINIRSTSTHNTNKLLALKLVVGESMDGRNLITLTGYKPTKYGEEYIEEISDVINIKLKELESEKGVNLLEYWSKNMKKYPLSILNGSLYAESVNYFPIYCFYAEKHILDLAKKLVRYAENIIRVKNKIPKIGEGWVGETELFYKIKEIFQNYNVIQHAKFEWLGRQHIDIYVEELKVAIEYQGEQHDRPIDFFGGEKAFIKNQKRDTRKRELCKQHNIKLIYVRKNYDLKELEKEIIQ